MRTAFWMLGAVAAALITTFAATSGAEAASCRPGYWLNVDGLCTPRGRVHCIGTNRNCPAGTQCVRLRNGVIGCRRR